MSTFTLLSGIFLFGLTQSKTSIQVNVLTCFAAMFQNAFYGVLYGCTFHFSVSFRFC